LPGGNAPSGARPRPGHSNSACSISSNRKEISARRGRRCARETRSSTTTPSSSSKSLAEKPNRYSMSTVRLE